MNARSYSRLAALLFAIIAVVQLSVPRADGK